LVTRRSAAGRVAATHALALLYHGDAVGSCLRDAISSSAPICRRIAQHSDTPAGRVGVAASRRSLIEVARYCWTPMDAHTENRSNPRDFSLSRTRQTPSSRQTFDVSESPSGRLKSWSMMTLPRARGRSALRDAPEQPSHATGGLSRSLQHVRQTLVRVLLPGMVGVGVVSAAAAHASSVPAPNQYNTARHCRPNSTHEYVGTFCGPWTVPLDPANPFTDSYGECVYWAIEKRPDIWTDRSTHDPDPEDWDAWTWVGHAQAEGLSVSRTPQAGDVAVWSPAQAGNATGHVAYVEATNTGQRITVSEMNHYFGTHGGDTEILAPAQAPVGWRGLEFIHLSSTDSETGGQGRAMPGRAGSLLQTAGRHHRSRPLTQIRVSRMKRRGRSQRLLQFTLRITQGRGTPRAIAVDGHHVVRLGSQRRSARLYVFTALLSSGRWIVTVTCDPARGYLAPAPIHLQVRIPTR
jgi:surface antigen